MIRNGQPIITKDTIGSFHMIGLCPEHYQDRNEGGIAIDRSTCLVHEGRIDHVQVFRECDNPVLAWHISGWDEPEEALDHPSGRRAQVGHSYGLVIRRNYSADELERRGMSCPVCRMIFGLADDLEIEAKWHPEAQGPANKVVPMTPAEAEALLFGEESQLQDGINSVRARALRTGWIGGMAWQFKVRHQVYSALRAWAKQQQAAGWPSLPEEYREAGCKGILHRQGALPDELRAGVPYQAYFYALPEDERDHAKAAGTAAVELPGKRPPDERKYKPQVCRSCGGTGRCPHCGGDGVHREQGQAIIGKKCMFCHGSGVCGRCKPR